MIFNFIRRIFPIIVIGLDCYSSSLFEAWAGVVLKITCRASLRPGRPDLAGF